MITLIKGNHPEKDGDPGKHAKATVEIEITDRFAFEYQSETNGISANQGLHPGKRAVNACPQGRPLEMFSGDMNQPGCQQYNADAYHYVEPQGLHAGTDLP